MSSKELADYLLYEAGVARLDGACFGEHGNGYLRFSYANSQANIRVALDRIRHASARWAGEAVGSGRL